MTTLNQAMRTLTQRQATQAALQNEQATRQRVAELEYLIGDGGHGAIREGGVLDRIETLERRVAPYHERILALEFLHRGGFFRRLLWLVKGG